jgi:two-component system, chemotaxis family, sensor kinase Cph1
VLGNLIINAMKFNESEQPSIEIGVANRQPPTIFVRDNGIGIAREHHETIFAPFSRLHSHKQFDGSGLGLAIVRRIVESYGGRVWLESEPGQGSTFYFSLAPAFAPTENLAESPSPAGPPHWVQRSIEPVRAGDPR